MFSCLKTVYAGRKREKILVDLRSLNPFEPSPSGRDVVIDRWNEASSSIDKYSVDL